MKKLRKCIGICVASVTFGLVFAVHEAGANAPTGACCLPSAQCEELLDFQCEAQQGSFIGSDTSCQTVMCTGTVKAPAASVLGLAATAVGLAMFGLYRVSRRNRQG